LSLSVVIEVGAIGGVGAIGRFLLDGTVAGRAPGEFPYGTLVVNLIGAFALGVLVGARVDADAYRLAGTALVGAFTTFSTWVLESHRLGEDDELRHGVLNLAISLVLGLAAAWVGQQLGARL
jgi:CrcB protein